MENAYFHGGGSGNRPTHHRPDRHISRPTAIKVCIFHDFMAVQVMVGREIVRRTISWTATKSWKLFRLILSFFVVGY